MTEHSAKAGPHVKTTDRTLYIPVILAFVLTMGNKVQECITQIDES